jgi:isoleucyl-tRNA synthetase
MNTAYDPHAVEKGVMKFWKDKDIYRKVKDLRSGQKPFFFMDGPPYATGSIHMGTAWNKIIKDTYIRFWRMMGYNVWDQPGYDTHGTPIEYQVEKELNFASKKDIEKYGVDKFIKKCRHFATKYIDVMSGQFADLGVWMDWKNPYLTLHNSYIEGAWHTFKQAYDRKLLYRDKYPVHVCPRCETVVSYNEIEHEKLSDESVYVKFRVKGTTGKIYLVIWTTTPWTLPANTGIMAHPDYDYARVKLKGGEQLIIAKDLVDAVMEKAGIDQYIVAAVDKGRALAGIRYEHPLKDLVPALQNLDKAHRVVTSSRYVTLDDGTGLVHTAPGHGTEDYQVGVREKLPLLSPVNIDGTFAKEAGEWLRGKFAKDMDPVIIGKLSERGALLAKETIAHDYPICWRCEDPLLQISVPQWFFKVTDIRKKLLLENRKVNWIPKWAGNRFTDWLENLGDWPVSRQRYWGIPLPIWECGCGHVDVIGSFEELRQKTGLGKEIDFHRPEIDTVKYNCPKCGKTMKRVPDVLDVWFDSGVGTWASLGYPRNKELFSRMWPSRFQLEGPDQFRGWWNSQMITSVLTFDRAPFQNVLLHGFVLDAKGIKMSKSKGNAVTPEEVIDKYGRDIMRFYLMSSPPWDDFYFNWESVKEVYKFFTVFWNVYQFIKTYAVKPPKMREALPKPEDRWIVSRVNSVLEKTKEAEEYRMHVLVQEVMNFILNDFSRWYIKLVRNRMSPWYEEEDKFDVQCCLYYVMDMVIRMLAPVIPFFSEKMYTDLFREEKPSVHMCDWPVLEDVYIEKSLESRMGIARELVEAINSVRQEKGMKLKWPVSEAVIQTKDANVAKAIEELGDVICFMGNVKEVKTGTAAAMSEFKYGKLSIGKVLEDDALVREIIRFVQVLRKKEKLNVKDRISLWLKAEDPEASFVLKTRKVEVAFGVGAKEVDIGVVENSKGKTTYNGKIIEAGFVKV